MAGLSGVRNRTSAAEIFLRKIFNDFKFHFNAVSASLRIFSENFIT